MVIKTSSATTHRTFTRRQFIEAVGRTGGNAFAAMLALGLLGRGSLKAFTLDGRARPGRNRVVILGAGLAGMSAAWELGKLGYDCTILEARERAGGRAWTARGGTESVETDGAKQVCRFDDGHFLNPGPMRIPGHHRSTLDYCKEFGVELQVFTNWNEAAYLHREGFPKLRWRDVHADWRGYTAELLAKAIKKDALDKPLTAEDREKLIDALRTEGDLDPDLFYTNKARPDRVPDRRSFVVEPGAGDRPGEPTVPVDLEVLIKSGYNAEFANYYEYHQQATMLTPVGGVDHIPRAFALRLHDRIIYRAEVREIRRTNAGAGGVRVGWADAGGALHETNGDFCICTIPPAVLTSVPADFSKEFAAGIAAVGGARTGKIGLQFKRRFWEEDDRIFGGISRTSLPITQIAYPFDNYNGRKGVLMGYYNYDETAATFGAMSPAQREAQTLKQGAQIHPQYPAEFENSFSVYWPKVKYSLGGWGDWPGDTRAKHYATLNKPDGAVYLAGEHMTYLSGWMAGAFESAHKICREVHARAMAG